MRPVGNILVVVSSRLPLVEKKLHILLGRMDGTPGKVEDVPLFQLPAILPSLSRLAVAELKIVDGNQ